MSYAPMPPYASHSGNFQPGDHVSLVRDPTRRGLIVDVVSTWRSVRQAPIDQAALLQQMLDEEIMLTADNGVRVGNALRAARRVAEPAARRAPGEGGSCARAPVRDDARAPDSDDDDLGVPEPPAHARRRAAAATKTVLDALLGHDFGRRVSTGDGADLQAARDALARALDNGPAVGDDDQRADGAWAASRRRRRRTPSAPSRPSARSGATPRARRATTGPRRARWPRSGTRSRSFGFARCARASPVSPADQAHLDAHVRDHVRAEAA
ncbi:hypothetical protein SO694_00048062 [Aureococcus anophagefferens]|uniref:Uncharacterized protein n=1 Tax=Aureococcus anophagefferens TaxID=44056 RepID=A0ABR1G7S5_AURAN